MTRSQPDACPGVLRPHAAADGALVRLRLPGGMTDLDTLTGLVRAAADRAAGGVQLTSRGNLQLRGVALDDSGAVDPELVAAITALGLLPAPSHERVRNIVASPLTGRVGGVTDLRPVVTALDAGLCADPALAALPGRFLFVLDDGRRDVTDLSADLGLVAVDRERARLLVAGRPGPQVALTEAPAALLDLARAFLTVRGSAWHVRELPLGGAELAALDQTSLSGLQPPLLPGPLAQDDHRTALVLHPPFGTLTAAAITSLRHVTGPGPAPVVVTPWRTLVLPDLTDEQVRPDELLDLVADPLAGWTGVSACTGAPGCTRALVDVRSAAAAAVAEHPGRHRLPIHVVACPRRCGAPAGRHLDVLMEPAGISLTVDGVNRPALSLGEIFDLADADVTAPLPAERAAAEPAPIPTEAAADRLAPAEPFPTDPHPLDGAR